MTIVIDPGHGGQTGARVGGGSEDDYVLALSERLLHRCALPDVALVCTRDRDRHTSFAWRAGVARDSNATLVVSLHVNSIKGGGKARGCLVFRRHGDEAAQGPAEAILSAIPASLQRRVPSVVVLAYDRDRPDTWTRDPVWPHTVNPIARYDCPAVLVECGYADDPHDLAELLKPAVQDGIADAVIKGIQARLSALAQPVS